MVTTGGINPVQGRFYAKKLLSLVFQYSDQGRKKTSEALVQFPGSVRWRSSYKKQNNLIKSPIFYVDSRHVGSLFSASVVWCV